MTVIPRALAACFASLALLATPLAAQAPAQAAAPPAQSAAALQSGAREGVVAAQAVGTGMWTLSGFAGGVLLGPVGSGLALALASGSASTLPTEVQERIGNREADYQLGFQQGYTKRITARRRSSALVGGITGSSLFLAAAAVLLSR